MSDQRSQAWMNCGHRIDVDQKGSDKEEENEEGTETQERGTSTLAMQTQL